MKECLSNFFSGLLPEGFDPNGMLSFLGFVIAVVFILGVLIRVIHQKKSKYNHALASALALLFAYTMLMWLHGGFLTDLTKDALQALPLIDYDGEKVRLFQVAGNDAKTVCAEFLHVFILSFILIGLDDLIPDAKNGLAWIVLQMFITVVTLVLYWFVMKCFDHFFPNILDTFAPLILVAILGFMIILAVLKVILGFLLVAVNPLLGAISAFFSTSPVGQAVGKAALCSIFLFAVCIYMCNNDMSTFVLADMNFIVCILPMAVTVGLWFVVGSIL